MTACGHKCSWLSSAKPIQQTLANCAFCIPTSTITCHRSTHSTSSFNPGLLFRVDSARIFSDDASSLSSGQLKRASKTLDYIGRQTDRQTDMQTLTLQTDRQIQVGISMHAH